MTHKELRNKPLAEAIVEVKWRLISSQPGFSTDPHYKFLLGRLHDKVSEEYPEHEQLATATIPDEMVGQSVQHRFRKGPSDWPLIQLGPGILTVNDTNKYIWKDFKSRSVSAITNLFEAYPKREDLNIQSLLLRYIDAVEFDYTSENVFAFLKNKMKVDVALPPKLFANNLEDRPEIFSWQSSFRCANPKGMVTLRFGTGNSKGKRALVWETILQSAEGDVPPMPQGFDTWLDAAHDVTSDWFFTLIEGELEEQFS